MKKILITILIVFIVCLISYFVFYKSNIKLFEKKIAGNLACVSEQEASIVRGQSLEGIFNDGDNVKILHDFYDCNDIQRGDVIIYDYSKQEDNLIKSVKAIPGDTIELRANEQGSRNIFVNGEILTSSSGAPYILAAGKKTMLELHINDFQGKVPENMYVILGNQPEGTLDSIRFGFVNKQRIIGKAIKI